MDARDRKYLERALKSAKIAIQHVQTGGANWRQDQKTIDAAAKRVEEVSEIMKRISPSQQAAMPKIPWKEVKGMREMLAHDYEKLDVDILDDVVQQGLPQIISEIEGALKA